jgi:hypothetical protein
MDLRLLSLIRPATVLCEEAEQAVRDRAGEAPHLEIMVPLVVARSSVTRVARPSKITLLMPLMLFLRRLSLMRLSFNEPEVQHKGKHC